MDCKDIQNNLMAFSEGSLNPSAREEVERHIRGCASCSRLAAGYLAIETAIAKEKAVKPDLYLQARILHKLEQRAQEKRQPASRILRPVMIPLAVAAALTTGFLVGNYGFSRISQPATAKNPVEVLRSDFYFDDFADEDITVLTYE